jgi:hypothetical protein
MAATGSVLLFILMSWCPTETTGGQRNGDLPHPCDNLKRLLQRNGAVKRPFIHFRFLDPNDPIVVFVVATSSP